MFLIARDLLHRALKIQLNFAGFFFESPWRDIELNRLQNPAMCHVDVSLSHIMDPYMEDLTRCPGTGERKVKRLYDTLHEPFKHHVSNHPPVPETPVQEDAEPYLVDEVEKDSEDTSKRRKKELELTAKSALAVAFAKYADKIGRKNNRSPGKKDRKQVLPNRKLKIGIPVKRQPVDLLFPSNLKLIQKKIVPDELK